VSGKSGGGGLKLLVPVAIGLALAGGIKHHHHGHGILAELTASSAGRLSTRGSCWPGYNATGAWAFPDAQTGLRYTVSTLNNGNYGAILSALRAGNNAQAVMNAIQASPWAASHYGYSLTASC
jgi:hypothetical protein